MRIPPRITTLGGAAALLSVLFAAGPGPAAAVPLPSVTASAAVTASTVSPATTVSVTAVGSVCYSALPSQAHHTLDLIEAGGPFPYDQDGTVFQNREGILPSRSSGYYHEYTVVTPGSDTRGARRIVTGDEVREDYYTADHYESFDLVDHGC
ncbi:ribonuclease [Streptomyces sp. NBC_01754]|uniref:ribonuclease n=1 Tax=Streptomyces sp. NBC_01754 TaxID=2975930 RepID=UPI002DDAC88B|nr:ribonuclease [Streptomyces sp. NBC_01754]WSC95741.1 ribonuclease [Streptomyces sp. NBC_01754]